MMNFLTKKKIERKRWFQENGGLLLQELIATCDGNSTPIRSFSPDQILKATNSFDEKLIAAKDRFLWYEGQIGDRRVLIKKWVEDVRSFENVYRDIAVFSLMNSHKNTLKLIGCCLEFPNPVLVCDYAENGALNRKGGMRKNGTSLPWTTRLKIAKEIANAVTYLNTAFPRTIVHRDIKPAHVFLDENWNAKLSDFSLSVAIPLGKSFVQDISVSGTPGYINPRYMRTGAITENTDVYGFGIFLLVLLTGKSAFVDGLDGSSLPLHVHVSKLFGDGKFVEVLDPELLKGSGDAAETERLQMEAFLGLALRCTQYSEEVVPKMIEVAKELARIEKDGYTR